MKKIILIGAGGQAQSCIDVIQKTKKFKIIGFIDKTINKDNKNFKVLGDEQYLKKLKKNKPYLHISLGFIKSPFKRIKIFNEFKKLNFKFPILKSPNAYISENSKILDGTIIHHNVVVNFGAEIGFNNIINTSSIIEHGARIGNNCHISTRVTINGDVVVEDNTFIGSGSVIREGVRIGKDCFIGMGQIITKNISSNSVIK